MGLMSANTDEPNGVPVEKKVAVCLVQVQVCWNVLRDLKPHLWGRTCSVPCLSRLSFRGAEYCACMWSYGYLIHATLLFHAGK